MLAQLKDNQETTPSRVPYAGPTRTAVARQPSLSSALPKSQFILNPEFFQTSLKHKIHSPSSAPAYQQFQSRDGVVGQGTRGTGFGADGLAGYVPNGRGDTIHASFVVIKVDSSWHNTEDGVDLVIKGPSGEQINDIRDKTSEKFEFVVQKQEHFAPLLEQIAKLEEALYNIQFEQHWLEAETDRQAIVNEGMSRRATHKALIESGALIGVSILQVVLLKRLFERKLGSSRV
ncbi:transmembrane emp24 domain-containing protein p24beta2 [Prunus yedoensis var. nudiflora]|uniref:Transmembrane emp24 domain-containing protein p24beta2 n=1 Tax=Prunus yedoensis var. nudiflora TaxID=2094558 RepID=A0A314ZQU7_PRUYE|nr:transmembrane emp24 domain-containing protein p24beta2 [Prunus yedoensis var. nudiflora]